MIIVSEPLLLSAAIAVKTKLSLHELEDACVIVTDPSVILVSGLKVKQFENPGSCAHSTGVAPVGSST
jgi:hypothetical protein